mgnify:FL=1
MSMLHKFLDVQNLIFNPLAKLFADGICYVSIISYLAPANNQAGARSIPKNHQAIPPHTIKSQTNTNFFKISDTNTPSYLSNQSRGISLKTTIILANLRYLAWHIAQLTFSNFIKSHPHHISIYQYSTSNNGPPNQSQLRSYCIK